jgi:LacI family transcriptional regulator
MQQRPTLHHVSTAANVSTFTASRALSGSSGVSAETRERVISVATALGYVPNQHARSLKSPKSNVVTVLTANIANHYYSVLVSNLEVAIEVEGFDCVTMDTILAGEYSQTRENRFVASLMAQRVAAVVVTYNLSDANMAALSGWGLPLIFVDCPVPKGFEQYSSVSSDSFQGSKDMGLHLAGHGYKRWAFVGHTETWSTRRPRQAGFEAAAEATNCTVDIIEGRNSSATAREAVTQYLIGTPRRRWPDVLYASNTVLLHGTLQAVNRFNVKVPTDIAIVAFDDFEWAEMLNPPVSVVDQDIAAIGKAAGAFLIRELKQISQGKGEEVILKPTLRIRQSCGCGCFPATKARQIEIS